MGENNDSTSKPENPDEITAQQAMSNMSDYGAIHVAPFPSILKTLPPVRIFNVFGKMWSVPKGGLGTFTVPPCADGMVCSPALEIPAVMECSVPISFGKEGRTFEQRLQDGRELALDILGEGIGFSPGNSLRRWGVFIARGQEPKGDEIEAARFEVWKICASLIADANRFWDYAEKTGISPMTDISEIHQTALRYVQTHSPKWGGNL